MKLAILFAALFAYALSTPLGEDAQILKFDNVHNGDGSYSFNVETSDGAARQEQGYLENAGTEHETLKVQGYYQFYGDDGQLYQVQYIADENGFQPQGAHLPVA